MSSLRLPAPARWDVHMSYRRLKRRPSPEVLKVRKKLLAQVGYTRMVERGLRSQRSEFPDLKVEPAYPTSDRVGNGFARPPQHPDARQFPVGHSHKQGLELVLPGEAEWMGGKKP